MSDGRTHTSPQNIKFYLPDIRVNGDCQKEYTTICIFKLPFLSKVKRLIQQEINLSKFAKSRQIYWKVIYFSV